MGGRPEQSPTEVNMTETPRETQVLDAVVTLVDSLLDDFDVVDLLTDLTERCAALLDVSAAGLLLVDPLEQLRLLAATSEQARELELFQLQADQGPCLDCFRTGRPVSVPDLAATERWPRFTVAAHEAGFVSVHAIPMRLRDEIIGALNLFHTTPGSLDPARLRVGQALADVATIGLLQQRAIARRDILTAQLQTALNSRILIEQAKGIIAERVHCDLATAFSLLRRQARSSQRRLSDLAQAIVDGSEQLPSLEFG